MPPTVEKDHTVEPQPSGPIGLSPKSKFNTKFLIPVIAVLIAGVGSGYVLASQSPSSGTSTQNAPNVTTTSREVGIQDSKTFRDCAQGDLDVVDPTDKKLEGSHKLIREGGPSQTLYLTSSVIALDQYVGKKVEICGETITSKKVAWFMEVGKLKLLD
jgi:hypothetical protein